MNTANPTTTNTNNSSSGGNQQPMKRSLAGIVTKLVGDGATYGFINDEIFFQQNIIAGGDKASVGDQVYADCQYSAHLPIKWNATSVRILSKANQQQQQQQQQQQPSQQNQFISNDPDSGNQSSPAITYQQHRQQRQMQQQQGNPMNQQQQHQNFIQQNNDPGLNNPMGRLLPDLNNQPKGGIGQMTDYNYLGADIQQQNLPTNRLLPLPQQSNPSQNQEAPNMASVQPMGPPNFAFPNQLSAPFMQQPTSQAQFMQGPPAFLASHHQALPPGPPPPHILAGQQQQPPPPLLPNLNSNQNNNQGQNFNQNQRHNNNNNNNNKQSGRFNDNNSNKMNDNNNRQSGRNNMKNNQRHDNKSSNNFNDRPRSNDRRNRDGSLTRHQSPMQQPSSNKSNKNDHTLSGNNRDNRHKRGDSSSRNSTYSANNITSTISEKPASKPTKRLYDVQNIPKSTLGVNLNPQNIKLRCPSSMHIPSDLKEIIVNQHFRLDLKNIPKPVNIVVDPAKANSSIEKPDDDQSKTTVEEQSSKQADQATPPGSKTDYKLTNKYGVKVILLSLPEMDAIYKHVYGQDLDSLGPDSQVKTITSDLDNMIQILCNKGSNNGYSLVGGKFDPNLDGFLDNVTNEYERSKKQPDLISTCRRVVMDQYNLDLSSCKNWTWLATFVYNNRTDYFSSKASIEYSYIYIPQLWTMKNDDFDKILLQNKEIIDHQQEVKIENESKPEQVGDDTVTEGTNQDAIVQEIDKDNEPKSDPDPKDSLVSESSQIDTPNQPESTEPENPVDQVIQSDLPPDSNRDSIDASSDNLSDLKVADLKSELDKLGVSYKSSAKKSDLVDLLRAQKNQNDAIPEVSGQEPKDEPMAGIVEESGDATKVDSPVTVDSSTQAQVINEESQLSEGEVAASADASDSEPETETGFCPTNKRKLDDSEASIDIKKACTDGTTNMESNRPKRIELIKEPIRVRPREPEQQITLVSLYETHQPAKYDQFELSMASNILKESLILHFSEYILTALVEDQKQQLQKSKTKDSSSSQQTDKQISSGASTSSQDTTSDTNNNASKTDSFKSPSDLESISQLEAVQQAVAKQEYPTARYINLAFCYFDANHMGYLQFEDLSKLFNNTQLTISKRALMSLIANLDENCERCLYQFLPDLSAKLPPTYKYQFPAQFSHLPGTTTTTTTTTTGPNTSPMLESSSESQVNQEDQNKATLTSTRLVSAGNMIQFRGETYDVEKLVEQVREAEALRVNLVDRFNYAIENSDKQAEEIHVLEVSRKSLANAIKTQNEEILDLKKERDLAKKKLENFRKSLKSSLTSLSDLLKEKEEKLGQDS